MADVVAEGLKRGSQVKVYYNDLRDSVTFKVAFFMELTDEFIILVDETKTRIHIPKERIVRIEEGNTGKNLKEFFK